MNLRELSSDWPPGLGSELILEGAPAALLVLDRNNLMIAVNRHTEQLSGFPRAELLGRQLQRLLSVRRQDCNPDACDSLLASAWSGAARNQIDLPVLRKDGIEILVEVSVSYVNAMVGGFVVVALVDITRRQLDDLAQRQMTALVDSAEDAIVMKSLDGIVRSWNPAAAKLLGYSADDIIGSSVTRLIPEDRQHEELSILQRIRAGQHVTHFETVRRRRDGSLLDVSLMISPVRDRTGKIIGASKIMRDLTDRNATLEQLRTLNMALEQQVIARTAQLCERDAMLQKIHHRVKNNLQVITSLINMQIRSLEDPAARSALRQCQSRITTMAQIHEMLYQAQDYAHIPFTRYAQDLVTRIMAASATGANSVALKFEMDEVHLPVDTAIPCGLILHELVSNAFKHAFSPNAGGALWVQLRKSVGEVVLAVRDNGIGMPADIDRVNNSSLGLELITTLVHQIDGELRIHRQSGTTFQITFPVVRAL